MLVGKELQPPRLFPSSPWLASGSPARGCPPSPAPGGGSQMSRGRTAHGAAIARAAPALAPAVQGEGRAGLPPAPRPPLPLRGRLGETPRGGWTHPTAARGDPRPSAGRSHSTRGDERPNADGKSRFGFEGVAGGCAMAGRAGVGPRVAVLPARRRSAQRRGRCPSPLIHPVCPSRGLARARVRSRAGIALPAAERAWGGLGMFINVPLRSVPALDEFAFATAAVPEPQPGPGLPPIPALQVTQD